MPDFPSLRAGMQQYDNLTKSGNEGSRPTKTGGSCRTEVHEVDPQTMQRLRLADAITKTSNHVVKGGNQVTEVYDSRGESIVRVNGTRDGGRPFASKMPLVTRLGAGYCGEHQALTAGMVAAARDEYGLKSEPVIQAQSFYNRGGSHAYTLIGDPREIPEGQVAVVDSWPTLGSAHTLDQNGFYHLKEKGTGWSTVESFTEQLPPGFLDEELDQISSEALENRLYGGPLSQKQRDDRLDKMLDELDDDGFRSGLRDQRYPDISKDVVKVYRDTESGEELSFDYKPSHEVDEVERKEAAYKASGLFAGRFHTHDF